MEKQKQKPRKMSAAQIAKKWETRKACIQKYRETLSKRLTKTAKTRTKRRK